MRLNISSAPTPEVQLADPRDEDRGGPEEREEERDEDDFEKERRDVGDAPCR